MPINYVYFLAIKIGLIGPNVPLELNPDQPNSQLVSRIQTRAVYNPYVSVLDNYRPSGLYMDKSVPQHYLSDHSQSVIKELRAGSRLTEAALLLLTIWMLQQQSLGFQPVRQAPLPPHLESARNLLFGKPKPDQFSCQNRFPTRLEGRKRCRAELNIDMDEQYRQFLLTKNTNTECSQKRFE